MNNKQTQSCIWYLSCSFLVVGTGPPLTRSKFTLQLPHMTLTIWKVSFILQRRAIVVFSTHTDEIFTSLRTNNTHKINGTLWLWLVHPHIVVATIRKSFTVLLDVSQVVVFDFQRKRILQEVFHFLLPLEIVLLFFFSCTSCTSTDILLQRLR